MFLFENAFTSFAWANLFQRSQRAQFNNQEFLTFREECETRGLLDNNINLQGRLTKN
jgi:hypothetical protein